MRQIMHKYYLPYWTLLKRESFRLLLTPVVAVTIVLFLMIMGSLFFLKFFEGNQTLSMRLFFSNAPMLLSFFCPALTMGLISEERRNQSLDWLLTLPIHPAQIILAKYTAACAILFAVLICTISYPLSLSLLGSLDWGPIWGAYIALFLLSCGFIAIGLWASSLCNDQVTAVLISFFICFSLTFIDRFSPDSGFVATFLNAISVTKHFQSFSRGVLDLRDIIYLLSINIFALGASILQLTAHRYPKSSSNPK